MMQNLYNALREKYNGGEVRDIKFIVNPAAVADQDVDALDEALAEMVRNAKPLEGPQDLV